MSEEQNKYSSPTQDVFYLMKEQIKEIEALFPQNGAATFE